MHTMGGCVSMPEPANGRPWQADVAPGDKSMCQSILDFFKKCGFSRRDNGEPKLSDNSIDAQVQKTKDDMNKMEVEMEEIKSEIERDHEKFDKINSVLNKNATSTLNQFESGDPSEAGGTDTDDSAV